MHRYFESDRPVPARRGGSGRSIGRIHVEPAVADPRSIRGGTEETARLMRRPGERLVPLAGSGGARVGLLRAADRQSHRGLIVDGRRPSLDFANHGDPRPVGNDLTFVFWPHHLYVAKIVRGVRPSSRLGQLRDSAAGPWSATRRAGSSIRRSGSPGGYRSSVDPWLVDRGAPDLGRPGALSAGARPGSGPMAVDDGGRHRSRPRPTCWPRPSRATIPTSGRPAGFPGPSGPSRSTGAGGFAACSPCPRSWPSPT